MWLVPITKTITVELLNIGRKTRTVPTAIKRDYQNRWFFKRPDGKAVPACGYSATDMMDDDVGDVSELFNNPPAGGLLTNADNYVADLGPACREPSPPAYLH